MKRLVPSCLTALAVIAGVSVALSAQQPDFSGTWIQNMQKSGVQESSDLVAYSNRIEHRDEAVKVVSIVRRRNGESTDERTYVLGREDQQPGPAGSTITMQVKWDGPALVFETLAELGLISADMRETWTLSADGKILTKERVTRSPLGENRRTFVLEKQ